MIEPNKHYVIGNGKVHWYVIDIQGEWAYLRSGLTERGRIEHVSKLREYDSPAVHSPTEAGSLGR